MESNELKCQILKSELERILQKNEEDFALIFLNQDYNMNGVDLVDKIVVKYNDIKKINIFVGITKLSPKYS